MGQKELYRVIWTLFFRKNWRAANEARANPDNRHQGNRSASQNSLNSMESIPDEEELGDARIGQMSAGYRFNKVQIKDQVRMRNNLLLTLPKD